jgi:hypothetical protein
VRYGNRLFQNGGLVLTFAGNLENGSDDKLRRRISKITASIFDIQQSYGFVLFNGFERISLVDNEAKAIYQIHPSSNRLEIEDLLDALTKSDYAPIAHILGVTPIVGIALINTIMQQSGAQSISVGSLLSHLNRFPFHNTCDWNKDICPYDDLTQIPKGTKSNNFWCLRKQINLDIYAKVQLETAEAFHGCIFVDGIMYPVNRGIALFQQLLQKGWETCINTLD